MLWWLGKEGTAGPLPGDFGVATGVGCPMVLEIDEKWYDQQVRREYARLRDINARA